MELRTQPSAAAASNSNSSSRCHIHTRPLATVAVLANPCYNQAVICHPHTYLCCCCTCDADHVTNITGVEDAAFFDDIDNNEGYEADEYASAGISEAAPKSKRRGKRGEEAVDESGMSDEMKALEEERLQVGEVAASAPAAGVSRGRGQGAMCRGFGGDPARCST